MIRNPSIPSQKVEQGGAAHSNVQRRQDTIFYLLFLLPAAVLILIFTVYPLLAVFYFSVTSLRYVIDVPQWVGLDNFRWAFGNPLFWKTISNTALFTAASLAGQTILGLFFAVLLNQESLRGKGFYRGVLMFAWIMPELIVAAVMGVIFGSNVGIVNHWLVTAGLPAVPWLNDPTYALLTLVLINIWRGLPFNILIYLTALQSVSREWYEAAELDGASSLQAFRAITLPHLAPTIASVLILGTIWTSNVFFLPFVLTGGGPMNSTMLWSVAIYDTIFKNQQLARGAAMSVVVYLILLVASLFYYRLLRKVSREAQENA